MPCPIATVAVPPLNGRDTHIFVLLSAICNKALVKTLTTEIVLNSVSHGKNTKH